MKKILKIGDMVYAQSIQHFSNSYLVGFPQREQFLLENVKNLEFSFYKHNVFNTIEDIYCEKEKLKSFLHDKQFDFILIDNPFSSLLIDQKNNIPIIFDSIDWYDEMFLKEFGINKKYYLLRYGLLNLLENAYAVISQSPVNLEALRKWGLKTDKIIVIPNGYDKQCFYPYSQERVKNLKETIGKKHQINLKQKRIIVFTGKLSKWYEKIKIIIDSIQPDQVFLIVGDGPLIKELQNYPNIIKCGAIDHNDVPNYTNIADVLVFPVDVDCSPIAISEYLAVGKPIVMGIGRMEWLLKNEKTGYMVCNNIYSWQAGIEKAIKMENKCRKYNLELAKTLSWEHLSKKFTDFINSI